MYTQCSTFNGDILIILFIFYMCIPKRICISGSLTYKRIATIHSFVYKSITFG